MRGPKRISHGLALSLFAWSCAVAQPAEPARHYASIQELITHDRGTGFSQADRRKLRLFRARLAAGGDTAIIFVEGKLRQMKGEENVSNLSGCDSAMTPEVVENAGMKIQLIEVLAEAYQQAPAPSRSDILRVLAEAYTPAVACDPYGARTVLDWAFARIGRDSVASLIQIGSSPLEPVRCAADDLANSFADSARVPAGLGRPPKLDCRAEPAVRARQLAALRSWWLENGSRIALPDLKGPGPGG